MDVVTRTKQHDTAILLCTFGSTYNESLSVYDDVIEDFKAKFPNTDIYMSFTSRTCIGRVEASTGIARYELDQWLKAIGDAGYKTCGCTIIACNSRRRISFIDEY